MEILPELRIKKVEHPSRGLRNVDTLTQQECF